MTRPTLLALLLALVLVAGCDSSSSPGSTDGPGAQGEQVTPAAAAPPAGGNTGGVAVPDIADALYTAGTAHVEASGSRSLTADATLIPGASVTTEGTTLLMYGAGSGQDGVVLSIANGPDIGLAMTLTAPSLITGGDGTTGCAFDLSRNDASGLTGSFTCRGISSVGLDVVTVDVTGTFAAER